MGAVCYKPSNDACFSVLHDLPHAFCVTLRQPTPMITVEVDKALEELKKGFSGVTKSQVEQITAKSLNAAMRTARTQAYQEIKRVYNLNELTLVTSKLRGRSARPGDLTARLFADRLGIQLKHFAPASSIGERKSYISVEVKRGDRKTMRGAFMSKVRSGAGNELTGLFARGGYAGRDFKFRTKRIVPYPQPDMPIGLLRTTSPFSMLGDEQVQARINVVAQEHFTKVFRKEMGKLIKGQGDL